MKARKNGIEIEIKLILYTILEKDRSHTYNKLTGLLEITFAVQKTICVIRRCKYLIYGSG